MQVKIIGKNIEVTEAIREKIESNLKIIDKYFENKELHADVSVRTYPVGQKIEITIQIDKDHVVRQEVMEDDLYDAINKATDRMERQIKKFKGRITGKQNKKETFNLFAEINSDDTAKKIVRRKTFENKLMTEEEALLQFELSNHDFYIFIDSEDEQTKILYKRKDQEYGIILVD